MSNLPVIFDKEKAKDIFSTCVSLSKSNLIPYALKGKPEDIFVILTMGHELDMQPMQALSQINVIQGKPTCSPQSMVGLVYSKLKGAVIKWELDQSKLIAKCIVARSREDFKDGITYEATWTMETAKAMGLAGKDNYKKQPLNMLKWRATAEACRAMFPDIILGLYTEDEASSFDPEPVNQPIIEITTEDMDRDFPIPEEEKTVGFLYRFKNGKFMGKQVKDCDREELHDYLTYLEVKPKTARPWHDEMKQVLNDLMANWELYEDAYLEAQEE